MVCHGPLPDQSIGRGDRALGSKRPACSWSMIFSENRYPLFGIMLVVGTKRETWFGEAADRQVIRAQMTAYLAKLNPEQRRAVEHGVGAPDDRPLLVIAGAGSGKTNTLAHRVAHLIVNGADPRKILLMTFSRRAAAEMARRVERICSQV